MKCFIQFVNCEHKKGSKEREQIFGHKDAVGVSLFAPPQEIEYKNPIIAIDISKYHSFSFITDTFIHEICHVVCYFLFKDADEEHGENFKNIKNQICKNLNQDN